MTIRKVRSFIFLRDVFMLSFSAFGGPQGHFAMFIDVFVKKRGYLTEADLIELHALCQVLPGPTSTQTITSLGFRIGGPKLAYFTLLVWALPAIIAMTALGLMISLAPSMNISLDFLRFVQPIAIGIIAFSSYRIVTTVVKTSMGYVLMVLAAVVAYYIRLPYLFPILIVIGGLSTSWKYRRQPIEEKERFKIEWSNLILWGGVLLLAAVLGGLTHYLPIRLFENFYRNGSMVFGGGQVLVPLLFTEFVEFKSYLTSEQFTLGYGLVSALPGPVFSFSAYVGLFSMGDVSVFQKVIGSIAATLGIFLPGTFLIFFFIRFWDNLKRYRIVKASLEGVNAVSSGLVLATTFFLLVPLEPTYVNYGLMMASFTVLMFTKIPSPLMIVLGVLIGAIL